MMLPKFFLNLRITETNGVVGLILFIRNWGRYIDEPYLEWVPYMLGTTVQDVIPTIRY